MRGQRGQNLFERELPIDADDAIDLGPDHGPTGAGTDGIEDLISPEPIHPSANST
jgi:hypothetical protein